jgi:hypothetical protein
LDTNKLTPVTFRNKINIYPALLVSASGSFLLIYPVCWLRKIMGGMMGIPFSAGHEKRPRPEGESKYSSAP